MAETTKESVYEEIRRKGPDGKGFRNKSKISFSQELLTEGRIKKIRSKYYVTEFAPTAEMAYKKVKQAGKDGTSLNIVDRELLKHLIQEGKIKKVYKKYYLSEFSPLTKREVIEHLLNSERLKRLGKTYYILAKDTVGPQPIGEVPSFLEFAKRVQEVYLHMAGEYRQSVRIMLLIEELTSRMDISTRAAEKWMLELPRVFLGRVDLRPFPGEKGLKMKDGSEVARIYLERGIVGL